MEMLRIRLAFTLLIVSIVGACANGQDTRAAEKVVTTFREQMATAALGDIYDAAAADWKKAVSRSDSDAFLGAVNRKLGAVKSTTRTGWRDNYSTDGHVVILQYHTEFEHGGGDETFTVRVDGDNGQLAGYNINSMAMLVN
jgi:hypothetical protein